ncbi:hypothetical protein COCCADRAFT_41550 [Bipolaris zeicola 26-R-13]|uniref:Uncharacterized protein n=1 Tax=Cochliobolus carbonum (strain 26-R-13) TaxID=930089 RepID=W6XQE3_COCC2|nr:uncharacterized protein COCCADRAFT_41550 [Bipolaris zeicola 26-R-13]EUC27823.1 hypothetical protein COCCADRAFT_41550 [Bipolaris zeicola 26-R-13]
MHASALTDAGRACTQHSAPMLMLSTPPQNNTSSSRPPGSARMPPSIGAFSKAVYGVRRGGMPRAKSSLAQQAYPSRRGWGPSPKKKTFCRPLSWDHTTLTLPWQLPVPYKPDCARKLPNYTTFITHTCSSAAGPMPLHISETPALHPMPTIVKQ